jgi:hypothetical protein
LQSEIRLSSFSQRVERWIDKLYILVIGSVGTDGARTRSFRLDRAVLWPIELQSQGTNIYSIYFFMIWFKTFLFRIFVLERRRVISAWMCTLVRTTWITRNFSLFQNRLRIHLYTSILYLKIYTFIYTFKVKIVIWIMIIIMIQISQNK